MRYLSVCSGIEAASVAWHHLGWEPVGFSEIEPFPAAVLAHRFPHVPNFGDMTKYEQWPIQPGSIDLLVGGTPCQSYSVAGLRQGLADPRGSLMLTYLAIAARFKPRWVVWENVPGVLSSNGGRDFGTFLGALGELGYGWAYRVLDAQYVRVGRWPRAVPQRRRRVFVVGCLGDGAAAAEVLALREGLQRHLEASGKARKGAASDAEGGARGGCWWDGGQVSQKLDAVLSKGQTMPEKNRFPAVLQPTAGTLGNRGLRSHTELDGHGAYIPVAQPVPYDLFQITAPVNRQNRKPGDPCHTLARDNAAHAAVAFANRTRDGIKVPEVMADGVAPSLTNPGAGGRSDAINVAVAQPVPIQDGRELEKRQNGLGIGQPGDPAYTVDTTAAQAVGQPVPFRKAKRAQSATDDESLVQAQQANTLNQFDTGERDTHAIAVDLQNVRAGGDVAGTLDTTRPSRGGGQAVAIGTDCYNGAVAGDVAATMGTPGSSVNASGPTVMAFKPGQSAEARSLGANVDVACTLEAGGGGNNKQAVAFHPTQDPINSSESSHALGTGSKGGCATAAVAFTDAGQGQRIRPTNESSETLRATKRGPYSDYYQAMTVRRLTPRECERLQGFPDDWTLIPWRGKPAEQCPDGPRYKALGNSMACNCMAWIGERIAAWEAAR